MPRRALHPCQHPGCPNICEGRYCDVHKVMHPNNDRKNTAERGYGSKWQKTRKRFLDSPENFFCLECKKEGIFTRATVVDHITCIEVIQDSFGTRATGNHFVKSTTILKLGQKTEIPHINTDGVGTTLISTGPALPDRAGPSRAIIAKSNGVLPQARNRRYKNG